MQFLICDDNAMFAEQLRERVVRYCARLNVSCTCAVCHSARELLRSDLSLVQVLFLDIDLPGRNGIDLARALRETLPELIIVFVTNWIQYAPAGYEVAAFRYLLKTALEQELEPCLDELFRRLDRGEDSVPFTREDGTGLTVAPGQILYLEGSSYRRVYLHTAGSAGAVPCLGKLTEYEELLLGKGFLRIQRSFLVNMSRIRLLSNYQAVLTNGETLNTSKTEFAAMKAAYLRWRARRI